MILFSTPIFQTNVETGSARFSCQGAEFNCSAPPPLLAMAPVCKSSVDVWLLRQACPHSTRSNVERTPMLSAKMLATRLGNLPACYNPAEVPHTLAMWTPNSGRT